MKAFLAGFGIGAGLGMLFAPKRGSQLRAAMWERIGRRHQTGSSESQNGRRSRQDEEILNTVTREQLLSVYGIGPVLADRIIQSRPYAYSREVVERGIIPDSAFENL